MVQNGFVSLLRRKMILASHCFLSKLDCYLGRPNSAFSVLVEEIVYLLT